MCGIGMNNRKLIEEHVHATKTPKLHFHFVCDSARDKSCKQMISFQGKICEAIDSRQCKQGQLRITALISPLQT